jgi:glycosyltransferase involved in cell wall biosynthesis
MDLAVNNNTIESDSPLESVLVYGNPDPLPDAEITFCIPTYQRPDLIKDALQSIIDQDAGIPFNIVVVDNDHDVTHTETLNAIKSFNLTNIAYYKNKTMLYAWNRALVLAKTKWCALLHDDDLLKKNYLSRVYNVLKTKKRVKGLCVLAKQKDNPFDNRSFRDRSKPLRTLRSAFLAVQSRVNRLARIPLFPNMFTNIFGPPSCGMVFDRSAFIESGGFDYRYGPVGDHFFCMYFSRRYPFYKYKHYLGVYRWINNASLKSETRTAAHTKSAELFASLVRFDPFCAFLYKLLKRDFDRKFSAAASKAPRLSLCYYIVYGLLTLWY